MASITTNAIVLRRADYKENDCMLTLFSPTMGRLEVLARGCRKQKSPLLAASELFASGEYVIWQGQEHATLSSCLLHDSFYPLRGDYERLSHAMYLLEMCLGCVQPDTPDEHLFLLLLRCLAHLAYGDVPAKRVTQVFLMGLASLQGYRPRVKSCQRCGRPINQNSGMDEAEGKQTFFSSTAGGVLCVECGSFGDTKLTEKELFSLQNIMRRGVSSLEEEGECGDALFAALRQMAETRLEIVPRSGKLL